jgi:hypothetical protein
MDLDVRYCGTVPRPGPWPWFGRLGLLLAVVSVILQIVGLQSTAATTKVAGIGVGSLSVLSLGIGVALLSASSLVMTMTPVSTANTANAAKTVASGTMVR